MTQLTMIQYCLNSLSYQTHYNITLTHCQNRWLNSQNSLYHITCEYDAPHSKMFNPVKKCEYDLTHYKLQWHNALYALYHIKNSWLNSQYLLYQITCEYDSPHSNLLNLLKKCKHDLTHYKLYWLNSLYSLYQITCENHSPHSILLNLLKKCEHDLTHYKLYCISATDRVVVFRYIRAVYVLVVYSELSSTW